MLRVGIHENVNVTKAVTNDQGTLEIEFTKAESEDLLGALKGTTELEGKQDVNIRVYGQNVDYFGDKRSGTDMLKLMINFSSVLKELLGVYIDKPEIDITKGLKVTQDNAKVIFSEQDNVDIAYNNIVGQFLTQIAPFVGEDQAKFRVKLPRRSKKYSFASLPNFGPWTESMDIPQDASRLKWSNWEITNGKNDPTPAKDTVKKKEVDLNDKALEGVFNKDKEEEATA